MWNAAAEAMSREEKTALQTRRLRDVVARVAARVPFYREGFARAQVRPDDIRSLDDLRRLPFTTKNDLRRNYPFGLLAVPRQETVEVHSSSGTTGMPVAVAYSRGDIDLWSEVMARVVAGAGASSGDVIHNAYGYGLFTGGLGFHYGAMKLGATVVPASAGATGRQIKLMQELGAKGLVCTPSYALHIAEVMADTQVARDSLRLEYGVFGAEPWSEGMRRELEARLGLRAVDVYGLSEVIGPGVASECAEAQAGLHINDDHFLPEIIDPETGETLPWGARGELVITTLTKEALPLVRYRTGDLTAFLPGDCPCGRTTLRMTRIYGRADNMLIIRGANVFPFDIEGVLLSHAELEPHYQLVVTREHALDVVEVQVEAKTAYYQGDQLAGIEARVADAVRKAIGLGVRVVVVPQRTIPRSEGKALRVVDRRTA